MTAPAASDDTVSKVFDLLVAADGAHQPMPTYDEMGAALGISRALAHAAVLELVGMGLVEKESRKARSIRLVTQKESKA